MPFAKSLFYFGLLSSSAIAWSSVGPSSSASDRRGFLVKTANKAAVVIGTVGVSQGFVESAQAATIYQPLPGSLAGQVHVITGSSAGLGLESAKRSAVAGATIVMTTRSEAKGEKAKKQVQEYLQERSITNPDIYALTLDLNDLSSVKSFPDRYKQILGTKRIDVLMNNAGAINDKSEITKDGFERTFQSNYLGPFLLTSALFPYLNRNGSRVINVSSTAHQFARIVETGKPGLDMNNLNGELSYGNEGWEAYGNTKLENILFTQELQRRADAAGFTWLTAVSLHPGVVGTDIWRNTYVAKSNSATSLQALASTLFYKNVLSTEEGANTQIMLATDKEIVKGKYYDEHGRVKELAPFARDEKKAKELWEISERLSDNAFDLK